MLKLGVTEGWRCLEIGAGSGSVAEWLCQQVGQSGFVVATDINTRFLDVLQYLNLEVRKHDAVHESLEKEVYDLVHARWVLQHIPERESVLRKMINCVKPGGWILVEEQDASTIKPSPSIDDTRSEIFMKFQEERLSRAKEAGIDYRFGLSLFGLLRSLGLESVKSEGRYQMIQGGSPESILTKYSMEQARDTYLSNSQITESEYDDVINMQDDETFAYFTSSTIAAWGRKPI